jgi:UDP-N-acetylglucosamine 2-epimerase (non-hydrolysing)
MKIAPIIKAIKASNESGNKEIRYQLVHTGQHYDQNMSDSFFADLNIPPPDANLGAGGGTQAEQTAQILTGFEKFLQENPTDLVIVVGDVTSTMACAITAKKMCVKVAHVEGGIRSGDITMPEEVNRIVTDSITDYFFTTSTTAGENLLKEGKSPQQIFFVGNTMIDSLLSNLPKLRKPEIFDQLSLNESPYMVLTLHRPANVDNPEKLFSILNQIDQSVNGYKAIFPIHPRTEKKLQQLNVKFKNIEATSPTGYLEFIYLLKNSKAIITDSGGITEEATVLGIPCITLRDTTERPETVTMGTNELIGSDAAKIPHYLQKVLSGNWKTGSIPPLWDGQTSRRIVEAIVAL